MSETKDAVGQPYGLGANAHKNLPPGEHRTNQRDERGNPVGVSTFAGAASPEHGLPVDPEPEVSE